MILGSFTGLWLILNPSGSTFAFVKTDQFNIVEVIFGGTSSNASNYINMTIQNTGASAWTLTKTAQVNGINHTVSSTYGLTCANTEFITVKIANVNWISGNEYSMVLLDTTGNKFTYEATANPGGHSPDPNPNHVPSVPSPSPPSLIAIIVSDVTDAPLIVASLVAIAEIAAGMGVIIYIARVQKLIQHDWSAPISARATAVLGILMFLLSLAACITFLLVYWYLTPPLTFSRILAYAMSGRKGTNISPYAIVVDVR
jgi:hypothetical protein